MFNMAVTNSTELTTLANVISLTIAVHDAYNKVEVYYVHDIM